VQGFARPVDPDETPAQARLIAPIVGCWVVRGAAGRILMRLESVIGKRDYGQTGFGRGFDRS
jgi:hypothetical protein